MIVMMMIRYKFEAWYRTPLYAAEARYYNKSDVSDFVPIHRAPLRTNNWMCNCVVIDVRAMIIGSAICHCRLYTKSCVCAVLWAIIFHRSSHDASKQLFFFLAHFYPPPVPLIFISMRSSWHFCHLSRSQHTRECARELFLARATRANRRRHMWLVVRPLRWWRRAMTWFWMAIKKT